MAATTSQVQVPVVPLMLDDCEAQVTPGQVTVPVSGGDPEGPPPVTVALSWMVPPTFTVGGEAVTLVVVGMWGTVSVVGGVLVTVR